MRFGIVYFDDWQAELVKRIDGDVQLYQTDRVMTLHYPEMLLDVPFDTYLFLGAECRPPGTRKYELARQRLENVDLIVPFQGHKLGTIQYYPGMLFAQKKATEIIWERWAELNQEMWTWHAFHQALLENPLRTWPVPATWWQQDLHDGIAVVIPCYDHEEFLPEAVQSAISGGAHQVIVVDDGSPGDVLGALKSFANAPVYVVRQENKGLPAARNAGIRAATMGHVLSLDADDHVDGKVLEKMSERLNQPLTWAYSDVYLFGKVHKRVKVNVNEKSMRALQPAHPAVMYPKHAWQYVGGYDESIEGFESWDFHARLIQAGWKPVKAEGIVHYRKHETGSMLSRVLRDKKHYLAELEKRNPAYFSFRKENRT